MGRFDVQARGAGRSLELVSHWNFWDISSAGDFTPAQWTPVVQMGRKPGRCEVQSPHEVPPILCQKVLSSCHIHLPEQCNKASFTSNSTELAISLLTLCPAHLQSLCWISIKNNNAFCSASQGPLVTCLYLFQTPLVPPFFHQNNHFMLSSFPSIIWVIVDTFLLPRFTKQLCQPLHSRAVPALEERSSDCVSWSPQHKQGSWRAADQSQPWGYMSPRGRAQGCQARCYTGSWHWWGGLFWCFLCKVWRPHTKLAANPIFSNQTGSKCLLKGHGRTK